MKQENIEGVGGWLLVYWVGSIPPLGVYSMGLSGWFFEYPIVLVLGDLPPPRGPPSPSFW